MKGDKILCQIVPELKLHLLVPNAETEIIQQLKTKNFIRKEWKL